MKPYLIVTAAIFSTSSWIVAQTPMTPYGVPINLEQARKIAASAQAEAKKNEWAIVVSIVDSGGNLVLLERMDNTQIGSVEFSQDKAKSAVAFRRPTKSYEEKLALGGENLKILAIRGAVAVEGGLPIIIDGKIVGGIGISGATSAQDGIAAQAGLAALGGK